MAAISLAGKAVVVTGAGRGLGQAMTLGLLGAGAAVTAVEVDDEALKETVALAERRAFAGRILAVTADVTDAQSAAAAMRRTIDRFGKVSVLVNNAAVGPQFFYQTNTRPRPRIWEADPALWRRTLEVNATGPFVMTCAALPHMFAQGWGRIVNVTTSLETMINPGQGPYGPAKAAAEAFTAMLAADLKGTNVTANVLVPGGPADTRMIPADGNRADRSKLVQPEVMVAPAIWLCSEASDGVTSMRFRGVMFDPRLPPAEAAKHAGRPCAWPQLAGDAIRPPGDTIGR